MAVIRFAPLEPPSLDNRGEEQLFRMAVDQIYVASGGQLNDFSDSSPTSALIQGQVFAASELLYWANKFSERVLIQYLQVCGIMQRMGSAASVPLTFTLTSPLASAFFIPKNYLVTSQSNPNIGFTTDQVLVIPAGSISGTIAATATDIGTAFNVAPYTLVNLTQPLAFLSSVTNVEGATGGTNPESDQELLERAFSSIRRRGCVTQDDYEQETIAILGEGSTCKCIGNLAGDRISKQLGAVHLFVLNSDGTLLNSAQTNTVLSQLQAKSHVTVQVYCSNVDIYPIQAKAIAKLLPGSNPETTAIEINSVLEEYLLPGRLPLGETIVLKELEYLIRGCVGVDYVQSVVLGGASSGTQTLLSTNLKLPHPYSAATLDSLEVELVSEMGSLVYLFGSGDPD